jgi:hypothetical protein
MIAFPVTLGLYDELIHLLLAQGGRSCKCRSMEADPHSSEIPANQARVTGVRRAGAGYSSSREVPGPTVVQQSQRRPLSRVGAGKQMLELITSTLVGAKAVGLCKCTFCIPPFSPNPCLIPCTQMHVLLKLATATVTGPVHLQEVQPSAPAT